MKIVITDYEAKQHAIAQIRRIIDYTVPTQVTIENVGLCLHCGHILPEGCGGLFRDEKECRFVKL